MPVYVVSTSLLSVPPRMSLPLFGSVVAAEERRDALVGADQLRRVGCAVVGGVDLGPARGERDLGVDLAVDGPRPGPRRSRAW